MSQFLQFYKDNLLHINNTIGIGINSVYQFIQIFIKCCTYIYDAFILKYIFKEDNINVNNKRGKEILLKEISIIIFIQF